MKIGVVGTGFVGLTLASVIGNKGFRVLAFDSDHNKTEMIKKGIIPFFEPDLERDVRKSLKKSLKFSKNLSNLINECSFIFLTVGTPSKKNGQINLTNLKFVAKNIGAILSKTKNNPIIIIKSTVVPGTNQLIQKIIEKNSEKSAGRGFDILSNPEFLREGKAIEDMLKPHIVIIGGNKKQPVLKLKKFYQKIYNKKTPIITTNPQTAEIVKYANNSFLATKISFINQIAKICERIPDTNVDDIAKAIGMDPRIGSQFLNAGPGFGGSCLPKDLRALISYSKGIGEKTQFFETVQKTNLEQVKNVLNNIKKIIKPLRGKKVTILGFSFQENSDDVRESVSIKLIKLLLKEGTKIIVHDPLAIKNTRKIFKNRIEFSDSISESLRNSNCAVIMTPWNQYSKISNKDLQVMNNKIIIDTRRILSPRGLNARYYALGIGN